MDWRELKNDRARAAYDNFHALDGAFDANVILQIKHGPIDFQVREPASPLFGALAKHESGDRAADHPGVSRSAAPCVLPRADVEERARLRSAGDLDLTGHAGAGSSSSGRTFNRPLGGFVGVSNVGRDTNWLGHDLAMANLYGFGRLAWNPTTSAQEIAADWTKLTFGHDPQVVETITSILLDSWPAYERYTGPLGAGTLTDIIGVHYGPGIESSERNGWGQWHRANGTGIGMDRTVATGTGFVSQYIAARRGDVSSRSPQRRTNCCCSSITSRTPTCSIPARRSFSTSTTRTIKGRRTRPASSTRWRRLERLIDRERYASVLAKLEYQAGHAIVWRDAINNWFLWMSGIPDATGRAGRFPGRVEAESMTARSLFEHGRRSLGDRIRRTGDHLCGGRFVQRAASLSGSGWRVRYRRAVLR